MVEIGLILALSRCGLYPSIMTSTRILLRHGDTMYRFVRVEARPDGSIIILVDRDPDSKNGGMTFASGTWQPDSIKEGDILPHGKFSCHSTGQINRYASGKFKGSIFIEPLHAITKSSLIGFYSIPNPDRLNPYDEGVHALDMLAVLDVPIEVDERLSFAFEIMPLGVPSLSSFGVMLSYEVYALGVRLIGLAVPPEVSDHFIEGSPTLGSFEERQVDIESAEIDFHAAKNAGKTPIYREKCGSYILLAQVPMRIPPKLEIEFVDPNLSIEQIPLSTEKQPTHKVRFWIIDKGGRNKAHDLRKQIVSISLHAEL